MLQPAGLFPEKQLRPCCGSDRSREGLVKTRETSWQAVAYNVARYGWFSQKMQKFLQRRNEQARKAAAQAMQNRRIFQHLTCDFPAVGQLGVHLPSESLA